MCGNYSRAETIWGNSVSQFVTCLKYIYAILEHTFAVLEHAYAVLVRAYAVLEHVCDVLEQGGVTNQDFIMQNLLFPE